MRIIKINSSKEYNIYINKNAIYKFVNLMEKSEIQGRLFIITDENIYRIYGSKIFKYFYKFEYTLHIIKPSEKSKSIEESKKIYRRLIENNFGRDTIIIALGGGVVGDLAGFIGSTYMRGIKFIQIPTTLLSQVDSSVGGKVAVNFDGYKNIIGSFYHPNFVISDIAFLNSLELEEYLSGLGEVIKYGLIKDYSFLTFINENIKSILERDESYIYQIVVKSISIKKEIVELDEKEMGLRMILNFGHTIGHGIECLYDFSKYKHGIAILIGMYYESKIAYNRKLIKKDYMKEIFMTIKNIISIPEFTDEEIVEIIRKVKKDKKNRNGKLNLPLPIDRGKVKIYTDIELMEIEKILKEGLKNEN